ncbi:MAG: hypothetical protein GY859_11325 [Desulfobacterales bacterium]|nr:hypothetical protein [Desulfobacterales bacterium]
MKKSLAFFVLFVSLCVSVSNASAQLPTPPAPRPVHNVCFYTLPNFQGQSYCATPGINTPDATRIVLNGWVQNWENRIQSIQLIGNAKVTVWNGRNYTGTMLTLTQGQPNLHQVLTTQGYYNWANQISSYSTHW